MDDKDNTITIDVQDELTGDMFIDSTSMNSYNYSYSTIPSSITISGSSSRSVLTSSGLNGTSWSNVNWGMGSSNTNSSSSLSVKGDAEFEGDVKIKGVSIAKTLEAINNRLAILQPDPAKLEHFAALKKAYEHYKTLEALCEIPKEEDKE